MNGSEILIGMLLVACAIVIGAIMTMKSFKVAVSAARALYLLKSGRAANKRQKAAAKFVGQLAAEFSKVESVPLNGRHLVKAKTFYLKYCPAVGVDAREFGGLVKLAKCHAEKVLEG